MSSLWTPSGERPVGRDEEARAESPRRAAARQKMDAAQQGVGPAGDPTEEELAAEMAEMQRQLAEAPAAVVVANHCIGLFQLAALHLNQEHPRFDEAQLAIDALGAIVEGLGDRLGDHADPLRDALAQVRLAFVQVRAARGEDPPPA